MRPLSTERNPQGIKYNRNDNNVHVDVNDNQLAILDNNDDLLARPSDLRGLLLQHMPRSCLTGKHSKTLRTVKRYRNGQQWVLKDFLTRCVGTNDFWDPLRFREIDGRINTDNDALLVCSDLRKLLRPTWQNTDVAIVDTEEEVENRNRSINYTTAAVDAISESIPHVSDTVYIAGSGSKSPTTRVDFTFHYTSDVQKTSTGNILRSIQMKVPAPQQKTLASCIGKSSQIDTDDVHQCASKSPFKIFQSRARSCGDLDFNRLLCQPNATSQSEARELEDSPRKNSANQNGFNPDCRFDRESYDSSKLDFGAVYEPPFSESNTETSNYHDSYSYSHYSSVSGGDGGGNIDDNSLNSRRCYNNILSVGTLRRKCQLSETDTTTPAPDLSKDMQQSSHEYQQQHEHEHDHKHDDIIIENKLAAYKDSFVSSDKAGNEICGRVTSETQHQSQLHRIFKHSQHPGLCHLSSFHQRKSPPRGDNFVNCVITPPSPPQSIVRSDNVSSECSSTDDVKRISRVINKSLNFSNDQLTYPVIIDCSEKTPQTILGGPANFNNLFLKHPQHVANKNKDTFTCTYAATSASTYTYTATATGTDTNTATNTNAGPSTVQIGKNEETRRFLNPADDSSPNANPEDFQVYPYRDTIHFTRDTIITVGTRSINKLCGGKFGHNEDSVVNDNEISNLPNIHKTYNMDDVYKDTTSSYKTPDSKDIESRPNHLDQHTDNSHNWEDVYRDINPLYKTWDNKDIENRKNTNFVNMNNNSVPTQDRCCPEIRTGENDGSEEEKEKSVKTNNNNNNNNTCLVETVEKRDPIDTLRFNAVPSGRVNNSDRCSLQRDNSNYFSSSSSSDDDILAETTSEKSYSDAVVPSYYQTAPADSVRTDDSHMYNSQMEMDDFNNSNSSSYDIFSDFDCMNTASQNENFYFKTQTEEHRSEEDDDDDEEEEEIHKSNSGLVETEPKHHPIEVQSSCNDAASERAKPFHISTSQMVNFNCCSDVVSDYGHANNDVTRNDRFYHKTQTDEEERKSEKETENLETDNRNSCLTKPGPRCQPVISPPISVDAIIYSSHINILSDRRNDNVEACSNNVRNFGNTLPVLDNSQKENNETVQSPKSTNSNNGNSDVCGNLTDAYYGNSDVSLNSANAYYGNSDASGNSTNTHYRNSNVNGKQANVNYGNSHVSDDPTNANCKKSNVSGNWTNANYGNSEEEASTKIDDSNSGLAETEPKSHSIEVLSDYNNAVNDRTNLSHTGSSQMDNFNGCSDVVSVCGHTNSDQKVTRDDRCYPKTQTDKEDRRSEKEAEYVECNASCSAKQGSSCHPIVIPPKCRDAIICKSEIKILNHSRNDNVETWDNKDVENGINTNFVYSNVKSVLTKHICYPKIRIGENDGSKGKEEEEEEEEGESAKTDDDDDDDNNNNNNNNNNCLVETVENRDGVDTLPFNAVPRGRVNHPDGCSLQIDNSNNFSSNDDDILVETTGEKSYSDAVIPSTTVDSVRTDDSHMYNSQMEMDDFNNSNSSSYDIFAGIDCMNTAFQNENFYFKTLAEENRREEEEEEEEEEAYRKLHKTNSDLVETEPQRHPIEDNETVKSSKSTNANYISRNPMNANYRNSGESGNWTNASYGNSDVSGNQPRTKYGNTGASGNSTNPNYGNSDVSGNSTNTNYGNSDVSENLVNTNYGNSDVTENRTNANYGNSHVSDNPTNANCGKSDVSRNRMYANFGNSEGEASTKIDDSNGGLAETEPKRHPIDVPSSCNDAASKRANLSHTSNSQMDNINSCNDIVSDYSYANKDVTGNDRFYSKTQADEDGGSEKQAEHVESNSSCLAKQGSTCQPIVIPSRCRDAIICSSQMKILNHSSSDTIETCANDVRNFCNNVPVLNNAEENKEIGQSSNRTNANYGHSAVSGNITNSNYRNSELSGNPTHSNYGNTDVTRNRNRMNTNYRIPDVSGNVTNANFVLEEVEEESTNIYGRNRGLAEMEPKCYPIDVRFSCNDAASKRENLSRTSSSKMDNINGCSDVVSDYCHTNKDVTRNDRFYPNIKTDERHRKSEIEAEHMEKDNINSCLVKPGPMCQPVENPPTRRDAIICSSQMNILSHTRNDTIETCSNDVLNLCNTVHVLDHAQEENNEKRLFSKSTKTQYANSGESGNWTNTIYGNSDVSKNRRNANNFGNSDISGNQTNAYYGNSEKEEYKEREDASTKIDDKNSGLTETEPKRHSIEILSYCNNADRERAELFRTSSSQMDIINGCSDVVSDYGLTNKNVTRNDQFYPKIQADEVDRSSQKEAEYLESNSSCLVKPGSICQPVVIPPKCRDAIICNSQMDILNHSKNDIVETYSNDVRNFCNTVDVLDIAEEENNEIGQSSKCTNANYGISDLSRNRTNATYSNSDVCGKRTNDNYGNSYVNGNWTNANYGNSDVSENWTNTNYGNSYASENRTNGNYGNSDGSSNPTNANCGKPDISEHRMYANYGNSEEEEKEEEQQQTSTKMHKSNSSLFETERKCHPIEVPYYCNDAASERANLSHTSSSQMNNFNGCSDIVSDYGLANKDVTRNDRFYSKTQADAEDLRSEKEAVETDNSNRCLTEPCLSCQPVVISPKCRNRLICSTQMNILNHSRNDIVETCSNDIRNLCNTVPVLDNAEEENNETGQSSENNETGQSSENNETGQSSENNETGQSSENMNSNYRNSDVSGNLTNENYGNSDVSRNPMNTNYGHPGLSENQMNTKYENWDINRKRTSAYCEKSVVIGNQPNTNDGNLDVSGNRTTANYGKSENEDKEREKEALTKIHKSNSGLAETEPKRHLIEVSSSRNDAASQRENLSHTGSSHMDNFYGRSDVVTNYGHTNKDVTRNDRFYPKIQTGKEDQIIQKEAEHVKPDNSNSCLVKPGSSCQPVVISPIYRDAVICSSQTNILSHSRNDIIETCSNNVRNFGNTDPVLDNAEDDDNERDQSPKNTNANDGNSDVSGNLTEENYGNSDVSGNPTKENYGNSDEIRNLMNTNYGRKDLCGNHTNANYGNWNANRNQTGANYGYTVVIGNQLNKIYGNSENKEDKEREEVFTNIHKSNSCLAIMQPKSIPIEVPSSCNDAASHRENHSHTSSSQMDNFNSCSDVVSDYGHANKDVTRNKFYHKIQEDEVARRMENEAEHVETDNSNNCLAEPGSICQSVVISPKFRNAIKCSSQINILNHSRSDIAETCSNDVRIFVNTFPVLGNAAKEDNETDQSPKSNNANYGNSDVSEKQINANYRNSDVCENRANANNGNSDVNRNWTNTNYGNSDVSGNSEKEVDKEREEEASKKIDDRNIGLAETEPKRHPIDGPFPCNNAASESANLSHTSSSQMDNFNCCGVVVPVYGHTNEDVTRNDRFYPKTHADEEDQRSEKEAEHVNTDNRNIGLVKPGSGCHPVVIPPEYRDGICNSQMNVLNHSSNDNVEGRSNDARNFCNTVAVLDNAKEENLTGEFSNRMVTNCENTDVNGNRTNPNYVRTDVSGNSTNANYGNSDVSGNSTRTNYGTSDLSENQTNTRMFQIENSSFSDDQRVPAANAKIASSSMIPSLDQQESFYTDLAPKKHFIYKGNFTWNKPLQDCSLTLSTNSTEPDAIYDAPAMCTRKSLRIGLSKRQKLPALHPYVKRRRVDEE